MLKLYLEELMNRLIHSLAARLNPDCRHVLVRTIDGKVVRCNEPSSDCERFYCLQHCFHVCSVYDDDGDGGDEEDIEPFVWEPKTEKGREVVES